MSMNEIRALEEGFEPGEIFRFVKRVNEKRREDSRIARVMKALILPDGTRAGVVRLDEIVHIYGTRVNRRRDVPFKGETLIEEIQGKKISVNPHLIKFMPNGEFLCGVELDSGWCIKIAGIPFWQYPDIWSIIVRGDAVIERIQGRRLRNVGELFILPNGTLAGNVGLGIDRESGESKRVLPFKGRTFITKIGGKKIRDAYIRYVQRDGTLVGIATLDDKRDVPFKGNILLDEIQGRKVVDVDSFSFFSSPDGAVVGIVKLEDGRHALFRDDALIEEISGRKIRNAGYIRLLSDGTIVGRIQVEGTDKWLLFKGNTLIDRIQGMRFKEVRFDVSQDVLFGTVELEDGRKVPFKEDALIEEVERGRVIEVLSLQLLPDKKLAACVKLEDGRCLIIKEDGVIDKIQGKRFMSLELHPLPDGTLAGAVRLEDDRRVPFKGDALLEEIDGRRVINSYLVYSLPDYTLAGQVETRSEERKVCEYFFWYGDEVHLPQPPDPVRAPDVF